MTQDRSMLTITVEFDGISKSYNALYDIDLVADKVLQIFPVLMAGSDEIMYSFSLLSVANAWATIIDGLSTKEEQAAIADMGPEELKAVILAKRKEYLDRRALG